MKIQYLNKPDKSDPENKLRALHIGPWKFVWRALWDNGQRMDYVGRANDKDVWEVVKK